ncbi:hypothetical protein [Rugamonas sp. DEMB1]|uniref:hypothetical protein n=1 Tax=Rugamonas sp. DEMB1 TaxID=3039386 RepID=UPI00244C22EA|nr:hypothetical protein [Rugamonas sp. DEMB1]WGG50804.1 hypothetical protein QC826_00300 [Rugamonas sp. DEMB1]
MQDATSTVTTAAPAVARPPAAQPADRPAGQPAYQRFLRMWHCAPLDEPEPPPQRAAVPTLQQQEEAADGGLGRARTRACAAARRFARLLGNISASPRFA